ncbi:MAG: efflux transporter outer membrane subunit [Verrucomicrobia bacterium]|nr:efflux transporter outer membrane subunit [Verrucomicrobiota bacterium]
MKKPLFLLLLLASGCHLGPRYESPVTESPTDWKAASESAQVPLVDNWWEVFQDQELTQWQKQVIEKNPNLYVALEKVAEARAIAGVAKSTLYPQVYANPSFNNVNELIELYGVPQGLFPGLKTITRVHEQTYQLPVSMVYEVDLWGKYRGTYNAAAIYVQAQDEAMKAVLLTLTTEFASNYYNARSLDTQIELLKSILELRREYLELTSARYEAGIVSYLDYLEAEKKLSDTDAEYQDTVRQRTLFENAMAALLGLPASEFKMDPLPLLSEPPEIPAGLPSDILLRRPDVAQSERTMASLHEFIGVAYSTYFPAFSLTSALGFSSPELSNFMTWMSRLWQLGVNMAQVIYNAGRSSSYVDAAVARFNEAKGSYENTVLSAFQEVEDALTNIEQQGKQYDSLKVSYSAASETYTLTDLRYTKGVSNYLDTIDAKRAELDTKRTFMNVLGQRYQSSLQLIKALGGGWESACVEDNPASQCQ